LENVRRDALLALADRINVPEVTTFVQGMIEAQAARTNILEALTSQAERLKSA
jgi:pilus assembly protein TadC